MPRVIREAACDTSFHLHRITPPNLLVINELYYFSSCHYWFELKDKTMLYLFAKMEYHPDDYNFQSFIHDMVT